jgi:hypothetical protein
MSELDFDELDKAVSTLMNDVPRVEPPKTDDVKTLNISSTLSGDARPSFAGLNSALTEVNGAAEKPAVEQSAPATPPVSLATRRSGRFMDVVHPSSNMRSAAPRPAMSTSRQGVTLQPDEKLLPEKSQDQSDVVNDVEVSNPVVDNASADNVEVTPVQSADAPQESAANDWPDPLDMSGYVAEPSTNAAPAEAEPAVESPVIPAVEADDEDDDDLFTIEGLDDRDAQPLNSPFIADAKVEKRPLGGAPAEDTVEELGHSPVLGVFADNDSSPVADPSDQLPADPTAVEVQLPPELQRDLMAIETDGGTVSVSQVESKPVEVVTEQPIPAISAAQTEAVPAAPLTSTGPTSIPQQYHEEQSTSDSSNGSIYDTDSYHQPLAHPAKAKSGWLWVIWIVLLLIVGGGGAVALYFLGII